jgi:hypothetical protein
MKILTVFYLPILAVNVNCAYLQNAFYWIGPSTPTQKLKLASSNINSSPPVSAQLFTLAWIINTIMYREYQTFLMSKENCLSSASSFFFLFTGMYVCTYVPVSHRRKEVLLHVWICTRENVCMYVCTFVSVCLSV